MSAKKAQAAPYPKHKLWHQRPLSPFLGSLCLPGLGIPWIRRGRTTFTGSGVGATLHGTCTWAGAGSWASQGRSPPGAGLWVKGWQVASFSLWKGSSRMWTMSKPSWFASVCTSVIMASTYGSNLTCFPNIKPKCAVFKGGSYVWWNSMKLKDNI